MNAYVKFIFNHSLLCYTEIMRLMLRLGAGFSAVILTATAASASEINAFRRANGLPPLHTSAALARAASAHARDLARRNHLDHDGFGARMAGYSTAAENVAFGCATVSCAFKMWANSAAHRHNMLLSSIKRYGLASAKTANGVRYWVLELSN